MTHLSLLFLVVLGLGRDPVSADLAADCRRLCAAGEFDSALDSCTQAAERGLAGAQSQLGWMYLKGKGVPKDLSAAFEWYLKAANQGHVTAQFNLGHMYRKGKGVERDHARAFAWWTLAGLEGDLQAGHNRFLIRRRMNQEQIAEGERIVAEWLQKHDKTTGGH